MVKTFAGINTARALNVRGVMRTVACTAALPLSELANSAPRLERVAGSPLLAIERPQSGSIPLPNAAANNRRNVIGCARHVATGSPSGSGAGAIGSGCFCGWLTGTSRGSTTIVRSGSPICIVGFPDKLERSLRWKACCHRMQGGGLTREQAVADQALTHVPI